MLKKTACASTEAFADEEDEEFVNVCKKLAATEDQVELRRIKLHEWLKTRDFRRTRQRAQDYLHESPSKGFSGSRIPL
jgi:hypothetical protein